MRWPVIIAIITTLLVLGVGGASTTIGPWYREQLIRPSWNPPDWAFGPAWTIILGLAAWAGVLAWDQAGDDHALQVRVLALYGANILFHLAWSPIFFNLKRPDWALVEVLFLWLSILALIIGLAPLSRLSAWLLAPYLAWVSFASYLNFVIVRINPPFSR